MRVLVIQFQFMHGQFIDKIGDLYMSKDSHPCSFEPRSAPAIQLCQDSLFVSILIQMARFLARLSLEAVAIFLLAFFSDFISYWKMLSLTFRRLFASKVIKTPAMADSISEGTLSKWHKAVGEFVKRDELIATVETDKVDVSVNSPEAGTVQELFFKEGDTVVVGGDLYKIDTDGQPPASTPSAAPSVKPVAKKPGISTVFITSNSCSCSGSYSSTSTASTRSRRGPKTCRSDRLFVAIPNRDKC